MKTSMPWAALCAGLIISACGSDEMPNTTGGATGNNTASSTTGDTRVCEPGSARTCYSGPMGTDGVGACKAGTEVCNAEGTGYGECSGEVAPQTDDCATAEDEDCDGVTVACSSHLWSVRFGDPDTQFISSIAVDAQDNIILTGQLSGATDFGGGPLQSAGSIDVFVTKLDAAGKHVWSKRFGDAGSQTAVSVATDKSGNVIVTGYFDGTIDFGGGPLTNAGIIDIFVVKLDASGNHVWSKRFGDAGPQAGTMVKTTPEGDIVLMSALGGSADFGGGPVTSAGGFDLGLAKLDAAGKHVWSKHFGDTMEQTGNAIAVDAAGNVLVTGTFLGTIDFGGGPFTDKDGGDVFVAKLGPDGKTVWSKQFGGVGTQFGYDIGPGKDGGVVLLGTFFEDFDLGGGVLVNEGDEDIFMATLDATGSHVWSRSFGDEAQQTARGLSVDAAGNIVITGSLSTKDGVDFGGGVLVSGGGSDAFAVKFDATGKTLWSLRVGDATNQDGYDTAVDTAGNVVLAGVFRGEVDFGGGPLTTAGNYDMFVAKLAP
jgi:hypothetical protein